MKEEAHLQQSQNLRVALNAVARDVRMAGNGLSLLGPNLKLIQAYSPTAETTKYGKPPAEIKAEPGFYSHADARTTTQGVRAIFGVDGGSQYSDTITIFRAEAEQGYPVAMVKSFNPDDGKIITDRAIPEGVVREGDIIALGNSEQAYIVEVGPVGSGEITVIPIKKGGRYTNTSSPIIPKEVQVEGNFIYNFRDVTFVTYYVDQSKEQLMADYHDVTRNYYDDTSRKTTTVANYIEDLQVYYYYDSDRVNPALISENPNISSNRLNNNKVKAVSIGLISRSPYGKGSPKQKRPAFFNRAEGKNYDNNARNILVETVYLRNHQK
jgi:hypothetical protein